MFEISLKFWNLILIQCCGKCILKVVVKLVLNFLIHGALALIFFLLHTICDR
jgi:hypothetical protein